MTYKFLLIIMMKEILMNPLMNLINLTKDRFTLILRKCEKMNTTIKLVDTEFELKQTY